MCIISGTLFREQPNLVLDRTASFLGLPPANWDMSLLGDHTRVGKLNVTVSPELNARLRLFYKQYDGKLLEQLELQGGLIGCDPMPALLAQGR